MIDTRSFYNLLLQLGLPTIKNEATSTNLFKYCRYPLAACEVLSIENGTALDLFLPEKPLTIENKIQETIEVEIEVEVEDSESDEKEE